MKLSLLLAGCLLTAVQPLRAGTNELTTALQKGLFEEEANHDLPAAIQAYQAIAARFDQDRRLAATAIYRLGECYRKQGGTNEAAAQYQRILREFSDQQPLATLSRQNLASLGVAAADANATAADAARQEQKRLLAEEILLAENKVTTERKKQSVGQATQDSVEAAQREVLELKRQLAALDAGPNTDRGGRLTATLNGAGNSGEVTSAEAEEIARIRDLIRNSPDLINAKTDGSTPLHEAAAKGQLVVARYLLENGADVNARGRFGADANGQSRNDVTPLFRAALSGHRVMVELLLAHGAEVDAANSEGETALHAAAHAGFKGVAEVLLARHANPNARQQFGRTPLHHAAEKGQAALVELLLAHGADLNAKDTGIPNGSLQYPANTRGATPLVVALLGQRTEIVKLLLAHQADITNGCEVNFMGLGPGNSLTLRGPALEMAVGERHPGMVDLLLKAGADPNASVEKLQGLYVPTTPLLLAVENGLEEIVRSLLDAKADANAPDPSGDTPLHYAVNRRSVELVRLLLAHGAKVNARNSEGATPLLRAVRNDPDSGIASLLLDQKADPNLAGPNGDTPLRFAVRQGRKNLVELLLAKGANPNLRNDQGVTLLDELKPSPPMIPPPPPMPGSPQAPGLPPLPFRALRPPGAPGEQRASAAELGDLLRQHGAVTEFPRLDRIELRRPSSGFSQTVFLKGTNDYNHFTLLELVAVHYGFVSASPTAPASRGGLFGSGQNEYRQTSFALLGSLDFPNLEKVLIRRPTPDGLARTTIPVDLSALFRSGDCSRDPVLQWGDIVELPEADHPISAAWPGLADEERARLSECLNRHAQLAIKGQTNNLALAIVTRAPAPGAPSAMYTADGVRLSPPSFSLLAVLQTSGLLRTSSDLSRVIVRRRDAATGQSSEQSFNCADPGAAPTFWLRDGDMVEVPEKP